MNIPQAHIGTPKLNAEYVIHGVGPREIDPLELGKHLWPGDKWASYQRSIVYSVWNNTETIVKAGNKLGKDWLGGFICVVFYLTRHPCRIVTTSAKEQHLKVLWGEIGQRIMTSKSPLNYKKGGPLICNDLMIAKLVNGERCPLSYLTGMVAGADSMAAMQGHHIAVTGDNIPRTMFVADEASSVNHEYYTMASSWFNRAYIFGNPWPCSNFFYHAFKGDPTSNDRGGDIPDKGYIGCYPPTQGYARKTFTLRASDSPNVRLGEVQIKVGKEPTDEIIVPGLKPYNEYRSNRERWNQLEQCVKLDGEFYEGQEVRMFPQDWLQRSAALARQWGMMHPETKKRRTLARGIGIDCAMGGDDTSMAAVDECGVLEVTSSKTPDTNVIVGNVVQFVTHWLSPRNQDGDIIGQPNWDRVFFDISGGGKQHADRLRAMGYNCRTIHFGSAPADESDLLHPAPDPTTRSHDNRERKVVYKNRRAEMYGNLRELLDPALLMLSPQERAQALRGIMGSWREPSYVGADQPIAFHGFAIPLGRYDEPFKEPSALSELHRQMGPIPLTYTEEGVIWLIPKHPKKDANGNEKPSLTALLGCSPDELDAVVLAVHAMLKPTPKPLYI